VDVRDHVHAVGVGHVIFTDLGTASGVQPGDLLVLFRPSDDLPRRMLGRAVVLTVEPGTSTVKIVQSVRELVVGDRVETMTR